MKVDRVSYRIQAVSPFVQRALQLNSQAALKEVVENLLKLQEMTYFYREVGLETSGYELVDD